MTSTQPTTLTAGTWTLDPATSTATFTVKNLGRTVHGSVPLVDGTVEIVDGAITAAEGTLDLGSIDTGHPKRDKDLRKPNLLDLDNHPKMTFTAKRVTGWHVFGHLRVHGYALPIEGDVQVSPVDSTVDSTVDSDQATMTATARFDRKPLGIRAPRLLIGRYIDITITATVRKAD